MHDLGTFPGENLIARGRVEPETCVEFAMREIVDDLLRGAAIVLFTGILWCTLAIVWGVR